MLILPVAGIGMLALEENELREALRRGSEFTASVQLPCGPALKGGEIEPLLTSAELSKQTGGIPASWFDQQARREAIPCHRLGRYVRFKLSEVTAASAVRERM